MKLAAIADVHGNVAALAAVLADIVATGITEVVNLGDHVSGPLDPGATADLLMARGFPSIRGNHDRVLVDRGPDMARSDRFALPRLSERHLQRLADMPATLLHRDEVLLCHGTPHACYAVLERTAGAWQAAIRYVAYDNMRMAELAAGNGGPEWASALATGWIR